MLQQGIISATDLTNPDFLVPEETCDISGFLAKIEGQEAVKIVEGADAPNPGNIPPQLYASLPGVMRDMHEYIVGTSFKPQPALALAGVLGFFAAAIGRKAELTGYGTRPNIYCLCVAYSGAGKERILSAIKDVAQAAGLLETLVGVEEVASVAGIVSSVEKQPNQVMLIDEVNFLISATKNAKAGVHIAMVTSTLLKLHSSSRTIYKGKSYADRDKLPVINQPSVSLVGCSTPQGLYNALSSTDVTNGMLSRMVLFDAGDNDPLGAPPVREAMRARFPGSPAHVIAGGGHYPYVVRPDEYNRILEAAMAAH